VHARASAVRKTVGAEALKDLQLRYAVVPRHERRDGLEEHVRHAHPPGSSSLRHGHQDGPAPARLVHVAPGEPLELPDAHPGRIEHERRQAVAGGEETDDRLDVLAGGRRDVAALLARELHDQLVAGRVRLDRRMVEDHREHGDCLPDRLLAQSVGVQVGDELRNGSRVNCIEGSVMSSRLTTSPLRRRRTI
jgi:hypothetical protein